MKAADDTKTADLLGDSCDLAGPVPPKPTPADNAKARATRYRERNGVNAITINLPREQVEAFDAYIEARNRKLTGDKRLTKNGVIGKLIETQLLRKR